MGHKGDIEARYSMNKGRLPPDIVEEIRAAYKRCETLLQTIGGEEEGDERLKETFRRQLLLVAGFKQEEVDKMDASSMSDEEFQSTVRQKLLGVLANNGNRQKVIPSTQIKDYLSQEWGYVAQLPNGEAKDAIIVSETSYLQPAIRLLLGYAFPDLINYDTI